MQIEEQFMGWQYANPGKRREEAAIALLSMAQYWEEQVRDAEDTLAMFQATKYSPQKGWNTSMIRSGGHGYVDKGIDRKLQLEEKLKESIRKKRQKRAEVMAIVEDGLDGITTPKAKEAIQLIHLEGMTAPKAGEILGVSDRHIRRLKAIGYQEMKLPDEWEQKLAA